TCARVGKSSSALPVIPIASSPAMIPWSPNSIRASATRSMPSPCTRCRHVRSQNRFDGAHFAMIKRFPGLTPTRSRAVVHDDLVFTVAVAPDPVTSSMYEQSAKALKRIDESLALGGTDKSRILSAIVYITDMARKSEMNRAWDEWVDPANPPM